jgi:hypothetical protein
LDSTREIVSPTVVVMEASLVSAASGRSSKLLQFGLQGLSAHVVADPDRVRVPTPCSSDVEGGGATTFVRTPVGWQGAHRPPSHVWVPETQSTVEPLEPSGIPHSATCPSTHGAPTFGGS